MSSVYIKFTGGKYKARAQIGLGPKALTISPLTGEGSIVLEFDSEAGLVEFGGKISEAVVNAFRTPAAGEEPKDV